MGEGFWHELRIRCQRPEFIATRGISGSSKSTTLSAFLGVGVPSPLANNTGLMWFSTYAPVDNVACVRVLRNYRGRDSLKEWCFKSSFFITKKFSTPSQLELYRTESVGYVSMCSKLLHLALYDCLSVAPMKDLKDSLLEIKYYNTLGMDAVPSDDTSLNQVDETSRKQARLQAKVSLVVINLVYLQFRRD